jgi:hypothetical protein
MTTWTTEDRVLCEVEKLKAEIKQLQDQQIKNLSELAIAMAEIQALRYQLNSAERGLH